MDGEGSDVFALIAGIIVGVFAVIAVVVVIMLGVDSEEDGVLGCAGDLFTWQDRGFKYATR